MKKHFLPAIAILLLAGYSAVAQNKSDSLDAQQKEDARQLSIDRKAARQKQIEEVQQQVNDAQEQQRMLQDAIEGLPGRLNEYDEIIIKKKNSDKSNEKLNIEIHGDQVTVNGKPVDDFVNDEVSVRIRSPKRFDLNGGPASRYPGARFFNGNDMAALNAPFLGVLTEKATDGAKIITVSENSAAEKAGLKKGDVITRVNNQPIADHQQLTEAISALKVGDKVTIVYKRDGKEGKTTAELGKRTLANIDGRQYMIPGEPGNPPIAPIPPLPPMDFNFDEAFGREKPRIGIKVQDTEEGRGAKVLGVDEGSNAEKAGIKTDDVITSFDGRTINSANDLADASRASKDKSSVRLQVKRGNKTQDIDLKIPKKLKTVNL